MTLDEFILEYEPAIRLSFFFGIFAIMAIWELKAPRRALTVSKVVRWSNNLGLVFLNSFILRFLFPAAAVGVAVFAAENSWGLLNYYHLPFVLATVLSLFGAYTEFIMLILILTLPLAHVFIPLKLYFQC